MRQLEGISGNSKGMDMTIEKGHMTMAIRIQASYKLITIFADDVTHDITYLQKIPKLRQAQNVHWSRYDKKHKFWDISRKIINLI